VEVEEADSRLLVLDRTFARELCVLLRKALAADDPGTVTDTSLALEIESYLEELSTLTIEVTPGLGDLDSTRYYPSFLLSNSMNKLKAVPPEELPKLRAKIQETIDHYVEDTERERLRTAIRNGLMELGLDTLYRMAQLVTQERE
jgi:hypothetical protein